MVKGLNFFNKLVYLFNLLFALLLLLASIAPYVKWELFSPLLFLSLIVPYLVFANLLFVFYWLFKRKKHFLISGLILLFGYFSQGTFVKFFNSNSKIKEGDISILTFNSHNSHGIKWRRNPNIGNEIADFVIAQDPDIVCFQEFDYRKTEDFKQYPYQYVNFIYSEETKYVIQAIFSKYPILSKGSLDFPESSNNAIFADVLVNKDTLRIYNLHLQSLEFRAGMIKRESPDRLFARLSKSFIKQQEQADLVEAHSNGVNYKRIICGDFNNTQFSSVYNTIKGEMTDSFQEMGSGLGTTYKVKFLPFRIDFILTDPDIEIKSHKNFKVRLSDHEPVMASFRFKE